MKDVPENLKKELVILVPASVLAETSCFTLYDGHPSCNEKLDITVCTSTGAIIEYYKREKVGSLQLTVTTEPSEISLHRNSKCEIVYLLVAGDDLFILSRNGRLQCEHRINNVESFIIDDFKCKGAPCLQVMCSDDAVPYIFNEDFDVVGDHLQNLNTSDDELVLPIETDLNTKLTLAKYNSAFNRSSLFNLKKLRQEALFLLYQSIHPNVTSSIENGLRKFQLSSSLRIPTNEPWIRSCNNKVVILMSVQNDNLDAIDDIQVLLSGHRTPSMTYTTKLYKKMYNAPFWSEIKPQQFKESSVASIVLVLDSSELNNKISPKLEFEGVVLYKMNGVEKLVPFESVDLTASDTMGDKFNVLADSVIDHNSILSILATSMKTELLIRHIKSGSSLPDLKQLFSDNLKMEPSFVDANILIHRSSPYHILNGVMLVLPDVVKNPYKITMYSRTKSQVTSLISYIQDVLPEKIVITTTNHIVTALTEDMIQFNDNLVNQKEMNLLPMAESVLKQTSLILEHYDKCMVKMNESKNEIVTQRIGTEIDVFANGVENFLLLKKNLEDNMLGAVNKICMKDVEVSNSDEMVVDSGE